LAGIKFQKRDCDFFVSYGHDTAASVGVIVDLLKTAGVRLWYDSDSGNAAVRSAELLGGAIGNSRGALFFLSEAWKNSSWCRDEYDVSLSERRSNEEFIIIAARLDGVEPPSWLQIAEIVDLRKTTASSIARLLGSLGGRIPHRFDNVHDIYLSCPWSRPSPLAKLVIDAFDHTGWRLIGDAPDAKDFDRQRIEAIVRTTRGMVAVLPYDRSQRDGNTSPYILRELEIGVNCGKPALGLIEPGVVVPPAIRDRCFRIVELSASDAFKAELKETLEDFDTRVGSEMYDDTGAFIFYGGSLLEGKEREQLKTVIERASNMSCIQGERLSGSNDAPAEITDLIRRAALTIADVSENNRNTLIEAGIAMGSGARLRLISSKPPRAGLPKKTFMFEGQEFEWYETPGERLCLCYYFAHKLRRRIYVR
jgi:hypothetical protein